MIGSIEIKLSEGEVRKIFESGLRARMLDDQQWTINNVEQVTHGNRKKGQFIVYLDGTEEEK